MRDDSIVLEMNPVHIDFSTNPSMGKAAFMVFSIQDCLEEVKEVSINTRSSRQKNDPPVSDVNKTNERPTTSDEICEEDSSDAYWGATNPPPNVLIYMEDDES